MRGPRTDRSGAVEEGQQTQSDDAVPIEASRGRSQSLEADPGRGGPAEVEEKPPPKKQANPNRLSVNLPPDTADALRSVVQRRGITITDATVQAISLLKYVDEAREEGSRVLIERPGQRPRELVFFP
jgi:hypothetical protein